MKRTLNILICTILFVSCKQELESPTWEVDMIVPVAHANMNVEDMITEVNSQNISSSIDSDSLISLVFSQEIIDINFDTLVKIDAITDEQTHTLDSASFADVIISDTVTIGESINEIPFGTILFPNGSTNNIPAIPNIANEDTINIDASEYFETMTLYKGFLIIEFINKYPTDISNISLSLINSINQNIIATFHFPVIASGGTVSDSVSIAGQTIDENILGILHNMDINASNSPVLINYEDAIITKITVSDIGITEATAIFPEQQLTENLKEHSFDMGNAQIKEIGIKSGTVKINVLSTLPNGKMIYNIPSLKKNGIPFTSGDMIIPEATNLELTTFEFNFDGYVLDLTGKESRIGGDTVNTIYTEAYTFIDYTGELVTINNTDSFYSYIEFDLTPEYAIGYLGQESIEFGPDQKELNIFNKISEGTLSLEQANLSLLIDNFIGADANIVFNDFNTSNTITGQTVNAHPSIIGNIYNINRATLTGGGLPINPTETDILLDAKEMMEIFPNYINIHSTLYLNPDGEQNTSDFLYPEFPIQASLNLEIPLSFIANNLIFTETIDANLSSDDELEVDELYITIQNGFPLNSTIDIILLDEYNNIIDTLINNQWINSGNIDSENKVTSSSKSMITIKNTNYNDVRKIKIIANFSTASVTDHINIYSFYNLDVALSAKFRKRLGK
tara:strand:+ start:362 stop:2401 length:2040 start_codon:yes stop_codon:yes gene_type:complete